MYVAEGTTPDGCMEVLVIQDDVGTVVTVPNFSSFSTGCAPMKVVIDTANVDGITCFSVMVVGSLTVAHVPISTSSVASPSCSSITVTIAIWATATETCSTVQTMHKEERMITGTESRELVG